MPSKPQRREEQRVAAGAWHGKVIDKLNIDQIAKLFDLPDYEELRESNTDYIFEAGDYAYKEALSAGASEEEAEAANMKAQEEADTELYHQWHSGVMAAADQLFEKHGLILTPGGKDDYPYEYRVAPTESWGKALSAIIETINGVGMFHFSSPQEFLRSGPYATARIGVLTHLHHIASYPKVYGDTSARRIYERSFR